MELYLEQLGMSNITTLNGFHNLVFQATYNNQEVIIRKLRVDMRRSYQEIKAEIDILNKIKENITVGEPAKINGKEIHEYKDYFYVFFNKVTGNAWYEVEHDSETYFDAGKKLSLFHQQINAEGIIFERSAYQMHPDIKLIDNMDSFYQDELKRVLKEMMTWGENPLEYGLIHGDYLFSNFIYQKNNVVLIDFDDMEYGYYLYDIAVYLFYYLLGGNPESIDITSNIELFEHFIRGYRSVNNNIILDFNKIQTLFRLRQLKLLATIKTNIEPEKMGEWQKKFISLTNQQITLNIGFVEIPYCQLYERLKIK